MVNWTPYLRRSICTFDRIKVLGVNACRFKRIRSFIGSREWCHKDQAQDQRSTATCRCRFPPEEVVLAQTMHQFEFAMFQSLKSYEPESVNELVRFNGKRAPSEAFDLSQIYGEKHLNGKSDRSQILFPSLQIFYRERSQTELELF